MRVAPPIILSEEERRRLLTWSRGRSVPHRLVLRSKAILLASEDLENKEIAGRLRVSEPFVGKWRSRFHRLRIAGIARDAPRPGRKPEVPPQVVRRILHKTLYEKPPGATHWSTRTLAEAVGVSHMTIARVWRTHRLKPHLAQSFKLSTDREFTEKLVDVVGLYVNPPSTPSSSAWTRRRRSRRSSGNRRSSRWGRASRRAGAGTTSGTARSTCSPPSTCWTGP